MKRSANDRGSRGNALAGIQSLTRSFSMYITYVYCAIIELRLWNIVPGTIKTFFFFFFVPGGNRFFLGCAGRKSWVAGRPRPAPPTVATTLFIVTRVVKITPLYNTCVHQGWIQDLDFFFFFFFWGGGGVYMVQGSLRGPGSSLGFWCPLVLSDPYYSNTKWDTKKQCRLRFFFLGGGGGEGACCPPLFIICQTPISFIL